MIAEMTNHGVDEKGEPILTINFVPESFITSDVIKRNGGYTATLTFDKNNVMSGDGEMYFNAYRLETDGGESEKHLFSLVPTMRPKFHVPERFVYLKDYV